MGTAKICPKDDIRFYPISGIVMGHCCRAYCGVNLDIPLGMASKFF